MSFATHITVPEFRDPFLDQLPTFLAPEQLHKVVGNALVDLFQQHIAGLPSNHQGFPSTNFWPAAARSVSWESAGEGVSISVSHPGFQQRLLGGTIRPTQGKKYLTIPAIGAAYGHHAAEFSQLRFRFLTNPMGRLQPALVLIPDATSRAAGKSGRTAHARAATSGLVPYYWLARQAEQAPNPGVVPDDELIAKTANEAVAAAIAQVKGGNL